MGIGLKLRFVLGYFLSPCDGSCHLQARFPKDATVGHEPFKEPFEGIGVCPNVCCLVKLCRLTNTIQRLIDGLCS